MGVGRGSSGEGPGSLGGTAGGRGPREGLAHPHGCGKASAGGLGGGVGARGAFRCLESRTQSSD